MSMRPSPRLTRFLISAAIVGLVFWGYQAHLHESVKTMTQEMLSNQMAKLTETLQSGTDPASNDILSRLKIITSQLLQQQQPEIAGPQKTSDAEFAKRRHRVEEVCSTPPEVPGRVHGVYTDKSGVLYCFVPKAGCTFWKRVFRASKTQNATKESVFSISRNLVHSEQGKGVPFNPESHTTKHFPTRLIVARDPYSRLLSSYLDKVYLPDFWPTEITPMIKRRLAGSKASTNNTDITSSKEEKDFLRQHFDVMAYTFRNKSLGIPEVSTAQESSCGKYMTFAEFVQDGFDRAEPHWMPIHKICNPCKFNVTHVIHMETFTEDARVILAQMGLENILDDIDDDAQVDEELKTIVEYNFRRAYHDHLEKFYIPCLSKPELAYRLWTNFQWRGYIAPDVDYKVPDFQDEESVKKNLMEQIWPARKYGLENRERMKKAKKDFKQKAFATISKHMVEKLAEKYAIDFKLFGYEDVRDKLHSMFDES